ncbi:putative ribonuclease H-like domain-containing protein [Tanacetum coccineum]
MVPSIVLTRSSPISLNAARPVNFVQPRTSVNNVGPMKMPNVVVNTARPKAVLSAVMGNKGNAQDLEDNGVIDSGCSRHMTGNRSYLTDYKEIDGGFVTFGGNSKTKDFKLTNESHVLLKVPRKDNMYSVDLNNIIPQGGLTCLFAKATSDESNLWHRRLGHVNFKTINKLVKVNLVRGLPSKLFEINQTCVACQKEKQHKASFEERKNRTLIEAARTMLADSKLLTTFWAEVVNTACYVQNRVLVIKPQNKTPYELFLGRKPALSFSRPFGCPVTILNTIDHLGKFDGKADEGFFVGYSTNSKVFRVFNSRTRIVEENLHVQFSKNTPNIARSGPNCLFDIDGLTKSMNYKLVVAGNQSNGSTGTKAYDNAGKARMETILGKDCILQPLSIQDPPFSSSLKDSPDVGFKPSGEEEKKDAKDKDAKDLGNKSGNPTKGKDSEVPSTEEQRINQEKDDNINSTNNINTASDGNSTNNVNAASSNVNAAGSEVNVVDPKTSIELPNDPNMPELKDIVYSDDDEDVGAEVDTYNLDTHIPISPIPTTRIHKNHPVEQIIGDIYSAPQTRRMTKKEPKKIDVKSAFLYGKIEEEVYVCQPPRFEDPNFPDSVYKRGKIDKTLFIIRDKGGILLVQVYIDDIIFGSIKKSLCTDFEKMMHKKFQMSSMGELTFFLGLQVKQKEDGIFISQDKYVTEILKIFGFSDVKTTSTPMETHKPLLKDANGEDVDEHLYRSMIRSLMYLTSLRPDIMFAVCQPKLGLWYPKDSPFDLVGYTDSDYAGASLNRKSTTGGCQFLGCRLISWKCKKQTVVANSTTEAEYIAASNYLVMSSASSAVTYTSVYTDSEPGRVFWGADEEISEGGPEEPQTPPVPQDEDEREPMFIQPHDPDYVPEPIYPEYIPLEDEHVFPIEEQPLPPVDSPTAESPGYVAESDPEEDPEEYEDDKIEDGPVDYPMDGGDDVDDDDDDSSGDDADDEDEDEENEEEEEEEHLALADSAVVVYIIELDSISLLPEAEVKRLLAMPTPSPSPPISLSPLSVGERFARDDLPESELPPHKRLCLSTLGSKNEIRESSTARHIGGRGIDYGFVSTVDAEARRQGISEVGYGIRDTWVDPAEAVPEIAPMTVGEVNTRVTELAELHERDTQDLYALLEDAQDGLSQAVHHELQTHHDHVYAHETHIQAHQAHLQLQSTLIQTQHQRAKQPAPDARILDHQDASGDADSHV